MSFYYDTIAEEEKTVRSELDKLFSSIDRYRQIKPIFMYDTFDETFSYSSLQQGCFAIRNDDCKLLLKASILSPKEYNGLHTVSEYLKKKFTGSEIKTKILNAIAEYGEQSLFSGFDIEEEGYKIISYEILTYESLSVDMMKDLNGLYFKQIKALNSLNFRIIRPHLPTASDFEQFNQLKSKYNSDDIQDGIISRGNIKHIPEIEALNSFLDVYINSENMYEFIAMRNDESYQKNLIQQAKKEGYLISSLQCRREQTQARFETFLNQMYDDFSNHKELFYRIINPAFKVHEVFPLHDDIYTSKPKACISDFELSYEKPLNSNQISNNNNDTFDKKTTTIINEPPLVPTQPNGSSYSDVDQEIIKVLRHGRYSAAGILYKIPPEIKMAENKERRGFSERNIIKRLRKNMPLRKNGLVTVNPSEIGYYRTDVNYEQHEV